MRRTALLACLSLFALPALAEAQQQHFTPAPVPKVAAPTVAPAERAGGPGMQATNTGPSDSTPFSASPSGTLVGSDRLGQDTRNETPGNLPTTPNLAK